MSDYKELVKELRGCKDMDCCTDCPRMANGYVEFCNIKDDAAAAIEELDAEETRLLLITSELQDKVVELEEELNDADIAADDNARKVEELQAEQKKTVTQIFCEEQMAWEGRCKDLMKQNSELQAEVDALKHDIARYVQMNTDLLNEPPQVGKAGNQYTLIEPKNKRYPLRCPKCGTVVGLMEVQE